MDVSQLQEQLFVIAEPTRFRIVELLRTGPHSVGQLVTALGVGQPQVSRHLRILGDAGVVDVRKQAQQRIYRLQPRPFREISDWLQSFGAIWSDRMEALDSYLQEMGDDDER